VNPAHNRREFLKRSAVVPLSALAGCGLSNLQLSAAQPIKRIGGPKLKISLNAYSFTKALNDHIKGRGKGTTLFDLLDFCAEQNFDAVDPTGYFFPGYPAVPKDEYINDLKRRAFELGLDISGTGVRNDFATPDEARVPGPSKQPPNMLAQDVRHSKEWVEVAAKLGAPVLRVFAGPVPKGEDWDTTAKRMAGALREVAAQGKKFGVLIGVQNHGDMLKTADECIKLIDMVNSDWFGIIVDTGYFVTPDPYVDIAKVMPYAVNMQIKERPFGADDPRPTDLKRLVKIILDSKYRGYLPIETLSRKKGDTNYNPKETVPRFLAELRAVLDELEDNRPLRASTNAAASRVAPGAGRRQTN
jgi:sugar phosphate isomerase/epimerase